MKVSLYSLLIAATIFVTSCTKEESEALSSNPTADIVGTWILNDVSCTDGKSTTEFDNDIINATFSVTGKNYAAQIVFKSNPNLYQSTGSYVGIVKSTISGVTSIQEQPFENFEQLGTYNVIGNKFIITSPGQPTEEAEIIKLTDKTLEYKYKLEQVQDLGVAKTTTSGTYTFKLSKK